MEKRALKEAVVRLGRAFVARGMGAHARALRLYYLALRHGLVRGERAAVKLDWSADAVVEWHKILRIPPWEKSYPLRARGSPCGHCPGSEGHPVEISTLLTYEGGAKMGCRACGQAWLEPGG